MVKNIKKLQKEEKKLTEIENNFENMKKQIQDLNTNRAYVKDRSGSGSVVSVIQEINSNQRKA